MDGQATTFGAALKAERERMDLTQTELARQIGTSQQNIAGWEKGRTLPRLELFDKLVTFFGKDSPIAALPPRGEIPSAVRHQALPRDGDPERPTFHRQPVDTPYRPPPAFSRPRPAEGVATWIGPRERTQTLRDELPPDYQGNVEVEVAPRYHADYWSETLGLELKVTADHMLLRVVRDGIQHLLVLRAKTERSGNRKPKHLVLAIVVPTYSGMAGRQLPRATEEADLLGVELLMCPSIKDVAAAITAYETGRLPGPEEDWDDLER